MEPRMDDYYRVSMLSDVCQRLDLWIEEHEGLSSVPQATFSYAPNGAESISIGGLTVWCSEDIGTPTFKWCRNEFLRHVKSYQPFWAEAADVVCEADDPFGECD
jgi:hypothetical protein